MLKPGIWDPKMLLDFATFLIGLRSILFFGNVYIFSRGVAAGVMTSIMSIRVPISNSEKEFLSIYVDLLGE
jgi:hypothetical protein